MHHFFLFNLIESIFHLFHGIHQIIILLSIILRNSYFFQLFSEFLITILKYLLDFQILVFYIAFISTLQLTL